MNFLKFDGPNKRSSTCHNWSSLTSPGVEPLNPAVAKKRRLLICSKSEFCSSAQTHMQKSKHWNVPDGPRHNIIPILKVKKNNIVEAQQYTLHRDVYYIYFMGPYTKLSDD